MHENGQYGHIYYTYDDKGNLIKIRRVSSTSVDYYVTTNIQGDVEAIYDSNGVLQCRYVYDAWGKTKFVVDGNGNEVSGNNIGYVNLIRYRGYYLDRETGLYYLQSRYYDPDTTRFINADDINYLNADILGTNLYIYCLNNCVNDSDPSGTISAVLITGLVNGAINVLATIISKLFISFINSNGKSFKISYNYADVSIDFTLGFLGGTLMISRTRRYLQAFGGGALNILSDIIELTRNKIKISSLKTLFFRFVGNFIIGVIWGALSGNGVGHSYFKQGNFFKGYFIYHGKRYTTRSLQMCMPVFKDFIKVVKWSIFNLYTSKIYSKIIGW